MATHFIKLALLLIFEFLSPRAGHPFLTVLIYVKANVSSYRHVYLSHVEYELYNMVYAYVKRLLVVCETSCDLNRDIFLNQYDHQDSM